ncbi:hypothetical protein [Piscinibacter sp. HJYY11]|uniref:hypothetical protein n=1 Tax=Piscinibacter sp. HJYY11 TaxID=2801333 RepID=UPI00191CA955|nr:hypothetical protein [Piscinibacter sp. HJYY11]MBL0729405.1 hypothetical protein [Piscinibacter sp. HJYY11]
MRITKALALGAACALWGCAGLQVDVDVYKGPLANLQSTQAQQLASMALGAKPLIIEYRNRLLDDLTDQKSWTQTYLDRAKYIPASAWSAIASMQGVKHTDARLRRARHLNGILTFYLDICRPAAPALPAVGASAPAAGASATTTGSPPATIAPVAPSTVALSVEEGDCLLPADSQAAGFGGRPREGIESLAKAASVAAVNPASAPKLDPSTSLLLSNSLRRFWSRDQDEERRSIEPRVALELLLVDFAGRVQFFTNNQWVLSDPEESESTPEAERLKTLLETVSNTIMVQADELRREDRHRANQLKLRAAEHEAAMMVRRPTVELMVDDLRRMTESWLQPLSQLGSATTLSAPKLDANQRKSLDEGLAIRRRAMIDALLTRLVLAPSPAADRDAVTKLASLLNCQPRELEAFHALVRRGTPSGKSTVAQARAAIDKWAADRLKVDADLDAAVLAAKLDYVLAASLQRGVTALPALDDPADVARDEAWKKLRMVAEARSEDVAASYDQLQAIAKTAVGASRAQGDVQVERLTSVAFAELRTLLKSLREEVIKAVAKRGEPDPKIVREEFVVALKRKQEAEKSAGRRLPELDAALSVVVALPPNTTFTGAGGPPADALDVLENYIAYLRYSYLDAVASGGESNPDARNYAEALVQARKQRSDMVYVRPSSAYLRSSLAATFAQENPSVQWSNMLNDTIQSLIRSNREKPLSKTREDLDKVFWQNINRVRLNAGGLTNYVVAKDDIGNWYVKGMGADPSAMINAAKNLALYNMGGRMNTNLLRADELRNKLDNDKDATATQRTTWQAELDKTVKNEGGAGITVRSGALGSYQTRYSKRTKEHLQDLSSALKVGHYKQSIIERWTATLAPRTPEALIAVMTAQEKAWTKVVDATQTAPADKAQSDVLIDALRCLEQYRKALRGAVLQDIALVVAQEQELKQEQQKVQALLPKVQDAQTAQESSAAKVISSAEAVKRAIAAEESAEKIDGLRKDAEQAVLGHQEHVQRLGVEQANLVIARASVAAKETSLRDATALREKAASDVDAVITTAVKQWVERRLRAVEELETATKVLGQQSQQ